MILTDEEVERFRQAYQKAYGEEMPLEEARVWALKLTRLYTLLLTPTPREQRERELRKAASAPPQTSSSPRKGDGALTVLP